MNAVQTLSPTRASLGQHLGNYRLVKILGQGGFATIYLGEHRYLGTLAAIMELSREVRNLCG